MSYTSVVGFDDSEAARNALETALRLAKPDGRVFLTRGAPRVGTFDPPSSDRALSGALSEVTEETAKEAAARTGLQVEAVVVNAEPVEALTQTAEKYDADVIVVGSKGQGALAGVLLGSTTYRLLHRSTYPVLVVPSS